MLNIKSIRLIYKNLDAVLIEVKAKSTKRGKNKADYKKPSTLGGGEWVSRSDIKKLTGLVLSTISKTSRHLRLVKKIERKEVKVGNDRVAYFRLIKG